MTLRYAHLFPSKQSDMAAALDQKKEALMSRPTVDLKRRQRRRRQ